MVDSLIRLYPETEFFFINDGFGILSDAISCNVKEEINGIFELELEYPENGKLAQELYLRRIIYCKTNPSKERSAYQGFRIYSIKKNIAGNISISAQHLSYDLSNFVVPARNYSQGNSQIFISGNSPYELLKNINNNAKSAYGNKYKFNLTSNVLNSNYSITVKTPKTIKSIMGGEDDSLLGVYGGEYIYNNFDVTHVYRRGQDNGVIVSYGKNLLEYENEENNEEIYSAAYGTYYKEEQTITRNLVYQPFSTSSTYSVGAKVTHEGQNYKCKVAVSQPGEWNDENWESTETQQEETLPELSLVGNNIIPLDPNYNNISQMDYINIRLADFTEHFNFVEFYNDEKYKVGDIVSYTHRVNDADVTDIYICAEITGPGNWDGSKWIKIEKFGEKVGNYNVGEDIVIGPYICKCKEATPSINFFDPSKWSIVYPSASDKDENGNDIKIKGIKPTINIDELTRWYAKMYGAQLMTNNKTITINMVDLSKDPRYSNLQKSEFISLGDTVHVHYIKRISKDVVLKTIASARCVTTEYDVIKDQYTTLTLGDPVVTISDTIAKLIKK